MENLHLLRYTWNFYVENEYNFVVLWMILSKNEIEWIECSENNYFKNLFKKNVNYVYIEMYLNVLLSFLWYFYRNILII